MIYFTIDITVCFSDNL